MDLTEGRRVLRMQRQHLRDNDKANVIPGTGGASPEGAMAKAGVLTKDKGSNVPQQRNRITWY